MKSFGEILNEAQKLDYYVVNTFGSAAQYPITSSVKGFEIKREPIKPISIYGNYNVGMDDEGTNNVTVVNLQFEMSDNSKFDIGVDSRNPKRENLTIRVDGKRPFSYSFGIFEDIFNKEGNKDVIYTCLILIKELFYDKYEG